jgi:mRNA m6A methyltransferase catalytic subunit
MPWEIAAASRLRAGGSVSSIVGSDVIFSERRGQSQKLEEVYELVEALVPGGRYLELFARKNNLRDFWTSIGNEITGAGLPPEDLAAMAAGQVPEGAVYGRAPG